MQSGRQSWRPDVDDEGELRETDLSDAFAFYREVTDNLDAGFIARANQNRCTQTPSGTDGRLIDWSEDLPEQETKFPELTDKEAQVYAIAVAKTGGYLDRSSDPPPGWETIWKGLILSDTST